MHKKIYTISAKRAKNDEPTTILFHSTYRWPKRLLFFQKDLRDWENLAKVVYSFVTI